MSNDKRLNFFLPLSLSVPFWKFISTLESSAQKLMRQNNLSCCVNPFLGRPFLQPQEICNKVNCLCVSNTFFLRIYSFTRRIDCGGHEENTEAWCCSKNKYIAWGQFHGKLVKRSKKLFILLTANCSSKLLLKMDINFQEILPVQSEVGKELERGYMRVFLVLWYAAAPFFTGRSPIEVELGLQSSWLQPRK